MKTSTFSLLSRFTVASLVLAITWADTDTSQAQRSRRRGRSRDGLMDLARDRDIAAELKFTDEQAESISELGEKFRSGRNEKDQSFNDRIEAAKDDDAERTKIEAERTAAVAVLRKASEADLAKLISAEQFRALQVHQLKRRGVAGIRAEWVSVELKLTDDQKKKLETAVSGYDQQQQTLSESRSALFRNRDLSRDERDKKFRALEAQREELGQKRDQAILGALSAEQKTQFQALSGASATAEAKPAATTKSAATEAKPAATKSAATPAPADRGAKVVGNDGEPAAAPAVVASFGSQAVAKGSTPAKTLKFNFVQAPWSDVLKLFTDAAALTWDRELVPPGTFTYFDSKEYTPTEALNVLNGAMLQKGFILVRRDRFAVVLNVDNPVPPNLVPTVVPTEISDRASNELIRVVMPLEEKDAGKAAEEVADLLGPQGKAVALSVANSLVVTGLAKNLSEIYAALKSYIPEEEKDVEYEAFVLKNVSAIAAEEMIRDLFGLQPRGVQNVSGASGGGSSRGGSSRGGSSRGGFGGFAAMMQQRRGGSSRGGSSRGGSSRGGDSSRGRQTSRGSSNTSVSVTVDERTNMLLAMAAPEQLNVIRKAIETIDVPTGDAPNPFANEQRNNEPYLEVYRVNSSDTMEVTKTLNVLFPGTVVNEDGRSRRIHVMASKSEHEEVSRMIRKLDGQGGTQTTAIIPIRQDPTTLTTTLQGLYSKDIESAPSVIANPGYLVVRGSAEQIVEIKQMVTQLEGAIGASMATGGGPIRSIPLGGRDVNSLLRMLQSVSRNPIRISTPASDRGPIREQRVPSADEPDVRPAAPTGATRGGGAAATNRGQANFSLPPAAQAASQDEAAPASDEPQQPPAVDEVQRHQRLAQFVFQNLDADKDGKLTAEEWSASKRTRALFEERKVELKLPADKAAFTKAFVQLAVPEEEQAPKVSGDASRANPQPRAAEPRPPLRPDAESQPKPAAAGDSKLPEIVIEIRDGNLVLMSEDEKALDELENRLQTLMTHMTPKTTWTIFYLRSADATEAALMLERLFPQSSVTATASSSGSSLFGEISGGFSSLGSSLMDMTGINSLGTGPNALRIIPETRANALFVSGPPDQIADVESVLKILDAAELPAQLRARAPRYINVEHADVNEVAQIVRDVYKEELASSGRSGGGGGNSRGGSSRGGSRGGSSSNPFAMFMGGGGGSSRGRGGNSGGRSGVRMTLGVDSRTSALIVSASDSLFKQVENLVATLDDAAMDAKRTVKIVTLENTNSSAIQQAVSALLPKASVSTGAGASRPSGFGGSSRSGRSGSTGSSSQAARMQQFMQMRGRGGSGGFGGRTGSTRGSSRGGSSRGGSSRGGSSRGGSSRGGSSRGGSGRGR